MATEVFAEEQSVSFVGGRGDGSGGVSIAGGCTKVWWDAQVIAVGAAAALAKLMGATGAPLVSINGVAYTVADDKLTAGGGVFAAVEVGMVVYVIENPVPNVDVATGRYKITAVDVGGDWIQCAGINGTGNASCDIEVGGAFDELDSAVDGTTATTYDVRIYTNLSETLVAAVTVASGGSATKNTFKYISGYNTIPGDMDRGGAFYESPFEILLNGSVNTNKTVSLDADGGAFEPLSISGDNVIVENVYLFNTVGQECIVFVGTPENIVLRNCRFTDATMICSTAANTILFDNCFAKDISGNHYMMYGNTNVILNCISEVPAGQIFVVAATVEGCQVIGCIVIGGARGIRVFVKDVTAINNTFYGQTSSAIEISNGRLAIAFNNIFMLNPGATALNVVTAGSFINDYNCFIESDGTALTVGAHDAGSAPTIEPNSIAADPLFVDAVNDDFRLRPTSPCRKTGKPTVGAI